MKLASTIKKLLGIIYVSLFSFALSVSVVKTKNEIAYAADSALESLTWSWDDGMGHYTATYDEGGNDECGLYAEADSATYDRDNETLTVSCTIYIDFGNDPDNFYGQSIEFEYEVASANDDGETYYFSGTRDGNTESIALYSNIVTSIGGASQGDPEDEYWFVSSGYLFFHFEDGSETRYDYYSITYYSNYDYVVLDVTDESDASIHQYVTVGDVSFSPEPEEDGTYSGTMQGILPGDEEYVEFSFSGIALTIDTSSQGNNSQWSYYNGILSYESMTYEVGETTQVSITQTDTDSFTVVYDIYAQNGQTPQESISVRFIDAEYTEEQGNGYYGMLSGTCDVIEEPTYITIYAYVQPTLLGIGQNDYEDGWNYIADDYTLVYWDSDHPDAGYEFSWVKFSQYNCEAIILYSGTIAGGTDTQAVHIKEAVFDANLSTISGYLAPEDPQNFGSFIQTDTYVTLEFEEETVQELYTYGWNFSQTLGEFIYYDNDGTTYDSLDCSSAVFYVMQIVSSQHAEVTYSVRPEGSNEPVEESFSIYQADYSVETGGYSITGKVDMDYDGTTYTIPVNFMVESLDFHQEFTPGFYYDRENYGLKYCYDEGPNDYYRTSIENVIWNYFGEESERNVIYIRYSITDQDSGIQVMDEQTVEIQYGVFDSEPGEQNNDGYLHGVFNGEEVTIASPRLDHKNVIVDGYNYLDGLDKLIIYDVEDDALYNVAVTHIYFDVGNQQLEVYSNSISEELESTINESFVLTNPNIIQEQTEQQDGIVQGYWEDLDKTITLTTPILTRYNETDQGWHYEQDVLSYYDVGYKSEVPITFNSAQYYEDADVMVINYDLDYETITGGDSPNSIGTIHISHPQINEDPTQGSTSYFVIGLCSEASQTVNLTISKYDVVNTGWQYTNGEFFWFDTTYNEIDFELSDVLYLENEKELVLTYNLFYFRATNGQVQDRTASLHIKNPTFTEFTETTIYYQVVGFCTELNDNLTLEIDSYRTVKTGWEYYNSQDTYVELYWVDANHDYSTVITEANYNEELKTVNIVYGIYSYEIQTGDGTSTGDGGPLNEEPVLIMEKVVHMTDVGTPYKVTQEENPEFEETMVFVRGTNTDVPEATLLSIPESKFNTIEYDPEAGTITPDQQIDIKELLPEETMVDETRMEESIVAISSETAHEIIVTVNDAHKQNEDALAAGDITQEQYTENKEIIQTVTEASVVVGAGAITASDEGKAVDNALPEDHELGFTMDETLNEFYQTQMDYLLGRKEAPKKEGETRIKFRDGEQRQAGIDLTISKEDYAKMIGFVDTAVSNMKDAALQIRKCSSAKMKKVVKDYISVVKVSSFRDFDEQAANDEFVEAVYKAIMLNMQQQVIEALKRDHKPSANADKEMVYNQQLAACEDFETFEEIVLEVLRQKYVSVTNAEIEIDDFRPIYKAIFRSWALDDPSLNSSGITLEQLTTATIETTKTNATKFTYRDSVSKQESTFFIFFGAAIAVGVAAAIATPIIVGKARSKRRVK